MDGAGKYDLNLLRVFVLVYETGSATAAAERLSITQPSVSYALGKLRTMFGDPLFRRGPNGLEPTPAATGLYPGINQSLRDIDATVRGESAFDPGTSSRRFRLMMTDLGAMDFFPRVLAAASKVAPSVRLDVVPLDVGELQHSLARSETDAAIGPPGLPSEDVTYEHLMDVPYVGVCAVDHPRLPRTPSTRDIVAEKHVVVSKVLGHEQVADILADLGVREAATVRLPSFGAVEQIISVTEYVGVVPKTLADTIEPHGTVRQFALPFPISPGRVIMHTYRRAVPSPAMDWLRSMVFQALQQYGHREYVRYPFTVRRSGLPVEARQVRSATTSPSDAVRAHEPSRRSRSADAEPGSAG